MRLRLECKKCGKVLDRNESINHKGLCNKHYGEMMAEVEKVQHRLPKRKKTQIQIVHDKKNEILKLPTPFTSQDVARIIGHDIHPSTISNVLKEYRDTGILDGEKVGAKWEYWPVDKKSKPIFKSKPTPAPVTNKVLGKLVCPSALSSKVEGETLVCKFEGKDIYPTIQGLIDKKSKFTIDGEKIYVDLRSLL